ncbi:head maturation protease, ClpP-related [Cyclobacterium sp.]|uniref:head maturation protease, ClpP-related n=1 Tax=Cyclobacterium sp. TaxID=1966343 RepID=UPI0019B73DA6|nr:head maturation protease, ClpP-related [Cyclobacterium sp.]MBD3627613.1 Clp protease ClpP [Cyclobacterium sp.]
MPQKGLFYEITNKQKESKTVDIMVYGTIPSLDTDTWRMTNTADRFVRDFKALEKDYDRINIHINSPGGSVYHGFPIFNTIAASKKDIHTYNDGLAASMAGVLLLAGKTVHTAKNALLMIHCTNGLAIGHAQDFRDMADMMDKYNGIIAQHFADKSGKSLEDIQSKYMNYKDHWLTAQEAEEEGFVDQIEDYESEDAPPEDITDMAFSQVMAHYTGENPEKKAADERGLFQRLTAYMEKTFKLKADPPAPQDPPSPPSNQTETEEDMDFKNSLALLAKDQVSAEDIAAIRAEIEAFTGANEKFTPDEVQARVDEAVQPVQDQVDSLTQEKTDLETEVTNLKTEKGNLTTSVTDLTEENKTLKLDIQAYRNSGVKVDNSGGDNPDPIEGDEKESYLYSETDAEIKALRAKAGIKAKAE